MRIALICPSNLIYMPYVRNYEKILQEVDVNYDIINWDRFNIEDQDNINIYKDLKVGHQRNFFDYYKYNKFLIKTLKSTQYDKIIVFGLQLTFFLKKLLIKEYKKKYIIDIRDYNRIIKFFNIQKIINNSSFCVISSPGYKNWLPINGEYITNHNTSIDSLDEVHKVNPFIQNDKINIAYIGAIRDYQINIDFINSLKNNNQFNLNFHGEGTINNDIQKYIDTNNINNVFLTGRYQREEEEGYYVKNDLINVLRNNDGINNKTALPNRLYNSIMYGKPILAYKGTYLAELIDQFNLGMVINSFYDIDSKIIDFFNSFNPSEFEKSRQIFLNNVIKENQQFKDMLLHFVNKV